MKTDYVAFNRTPLLEVTVDDDCKNTVVYTKGTADGKWIAKTLYEGESKKETLLEMVNFGMVETDHLMRMFEFYMHNRMRNPNDRGVNFDINKVSESKYRKYFTAWLNKYVSGDWLEAMLKHDNSIVAVEWGNVEND